MATMDSLDRQRRIYEDYYTQYSHPAAQLEQLISRWQKRILDRILRGSHRILDVGCGAGYVSSAMGASGKEVVAIDISSSAVRRATKHPNVRFLNCSIEEFESETGFDAVLLLDVIEHLGQPLRVLHRIHTLLNPEGLIVVCTPNSTSGIKRVKRLIGMKEVLPPCHEQEFSWKGLRCALASSGFRVTYATGCLLGPKRLLPVRWLNELNIRAGVIAPSVAQVMVAVGRK